ncbi:unnamed protein product [Urochloa humidicola]
MAIGSPPPATIEAAGLDARQEQPMEAEGNLQEEQPAHTPTENMAKPKRKTQTLSFYKKIEVPAVDLQVQGEDQDYLVGQN